MRTITAPAAMIPAAAYHARLATLLRRKAGFLVSEVRDAAMRAPALADADRRAILASLGDVIRGTVVCPACAAKGPHASNGHHRFAQLKFQCACGCTFTAAQAA